MRLAGLVDNKQMGIGALIKIGKLRVVVAGVGIVAAVIAAVFYVNLWAAPEKSAEVERFVIPLGYSNEQAAAKLKEEGFIKSEVGWRIAWGLRRGGREITSGGYKLSKAISAWQTAGILKGASYMKWVVIPEGMRKEETAEILTKELGWSEAEKEKWVMVDTAINSDHTEGVYFPDTYLISVDEEPTRVAERMRTTFNEKIAPYAAEALKQNIKWTTLIKIASIAQREAAGKEDMPVIAGVLWNRLEDGMKLQIDATVQYARGDKGKGWWAPITIADKKIDSPYNTYKYMGLPPHPIVSPGLSAIEAVLHPQKTKCFYYLHDRAGDIHCAETYVEHQKNIEEYLK